MGNRQVSISIRAAFDSAFKATFTTADKKVKELNDSLKAMKRTSSEIRGLSRIKEDLEGLGKSLQKQKSDLEAVRLAKEKGIATEKLLQDRVESLDAALKKALTEHKSMRDALIKESAAVQQSLRPTAEKIAMLERLKKTVREASSAQLAGGRELTSARNALQGQLESIGRLNSKLKENQSALESAQVAASTASDAHNGLRSDFDKLRVSIKANKEPTTEETLALSQLRERTLAAKQSLGEAQREVTRLSRAMEENRSRTTDAAQRLTFLGERLKRAETAAGEASSEYARLSEALTRMKASMAAGPTALQTSTLNALEAAVAKAGVAVTATKNDMEKAKTEQKSYRASTVESKTSIEQLSKKEVELSSAISGTEAQLRRATSASNGYTESLQKQGHDVQNLAAAEEKHLIALTATERKLKTIETSKDLSMRARDLRSEAMSSLYFTLGYGFLFTKPIREAVEFEKAMVRVKAMSGATSLEFARLRDDARRLARETPFTAIEVSGAYNELATAGFRPDSMIAMMPHLLDLANSSMTSLARTAEITSDVIQGFNLDVTEMKRVGDSLTAAYSGSSSSLESLGEMLKYVSSISVDVRSSLEQTLGASSILHNSGIKGSMAGTGLRAFFLRLSDPPKKLKKMLEDMDINVRDKAGNMRNWIEILHDVNRALDGTGTAVKAAAYKKLGGEEHATTVSKLAGAEKTGALQMEIKKYENAPAFNELGKKLLSMPDAEVQEVGRELGVKFNKAMSGGGLVASLAGSLKGLKGKEFESQMQSIFAKIKIVPSLADAKPEEYRDQGKKTEDALRQLQIDPKKRAGGLKDNMELTREIKTQLQTLPIQEQLKYIELFFSRTRLGVRSLLTELSPGGQKAAELAAGLNDTLDMEKTREELNKSAAYALKNIRGDFNDIIVSLGNSLLPLLMDVVATAKPYTEAFAKWISAHQGFAKTVMLAAGALFAFNAAVGIMKFGLSGIVSTLGAGKKIGELFGKDTRGREAAKGLWKAGRWLGGKSWKALKWGGAKGFTALKWGGGAFVSGIKGLISMGPRIASSMGTVFSVIRALGLAMVTTPIGLVITGLVIGAVLIWRNWSTVGPWLMKMWGHLKSFFSNLWQHIVTTMKTAWEFIKIYMAWNPVVYIIKNWEKLVDMFKWVWEKVKPYVKMLFPSMDAGISILGPDNEPSFLSRMTDGAKDLFSGAFGADSQQKISMPSMPMTEKVSERTGQVSQRNVITVNATIHVDAGASAPAKVASRIKGEIESAFRNVPSFSFVDPVVVS